VQIEAVAQFTDNEAAEDTWEKLGDFQEDDM